MVRIGADRCRSRVAFLLLTSFFAIMTEPFAKSIHSTGKMQLISIVGGLYVLLQFSSSIGFIAPTTTISMLSWWLLLDVLVRYSNVLPFLKRVLPELPQRPLFFTMTKVSLTVVVATLPVFAIEDYISHPFLRLLLTTLLYIVSLGGLSYTLLLSKQERNAVLAILQKQLQKFHLRKKRQ